MDTTTDDAIVKMVISLMRTPVVQAVMEQLAPCWKTFDKLDATLKKFRPVHDEIGTDAARLSKKSPQDGCL